MRDIRDELANLLAPIRKNPPSVSTIHAWQKAAKTHDEAEAQANAAFARPSALPPKRDITTEEPANVAKPVAAKPVEPDPPLVIDPAELADTDPRSIRDRSISWYTMMLARLRRQAETALVAGRFREARDIGALARTYEERRDELLPPPAPDPDKDPAYRMASEQIVVDLREVMKALRRKEAPPTRVVPPVEVIQPS